MPPGFTAEERARITDTLLETGRRLFVTQGLRKTSLDDLVRPAGIAKSSFYAFFDSKEALYQALMLRQLPEIEQRLGSTLHGSARKAIRRWLHATIDLLTTNDLYRRLVTHPDELAAVAARVDDGGLAEVQQAATTPILDFIARAQRKGEITGADPMTVLGVLQTVLLLPLHEKDFGERYRSVVDLAVESVSTGLTR